MLLLHISVRYFYFSLFLFLQVFSVFIFFFLLFLFFLFFAFFSYFSYYFLMPYYFYSALLFSLLLFLFNFYHLYSYSSLLLSFFIAIAMTMSYFSLFFDLFHPNILIYSLFTLDMMNRINFPGRSETDLWRSQHLRTSPWNLKGKGYSRISFMC